MALGYLPHLTDEKAGHHGKPTHLRSERAVAACNQILDFSSTVPSRL
jgi:hypothetical protein